MSTVKYQSKYLWDGGLLFCSEVSRNAVYMVKALKLTMFDHIFAIYNKLIN